MQITDLRIINIQMIAWENYRNEHKTGLQRVLRKLSTYGKVKKRTTYDPAISLPGMYQMKIRTLI